jgi:uncharacterized membrane protein
MIKIETAINAIEKLLIWDVGAFAILVGFILLRIRRAGHDPVGAYAKSRLSLAVDVRFLTHLGKRYSEIFGSRKIKAAYETVLWVGVIGFCISFILAVISAIQH